MTSLAIAKWIRVAIKWCMIQMRNIEPPHWKSWETTIASSNCSTKLLLYQAQHISKIVKYACLIIVAYMSSICSARNALRCLAFNFLSLLSFNSISAKTEVVSAEVPLLFCRPGSCKHSLPIWESHMHFLRWDFLVIRTLWAGIYYHIVGSGCFLPYVRISLTHYLE